MTIYAPHKVDAGSRKYRAIRAEMSSMGAPVIRAVDGGDCYYAIEGSHRLAIAAELGLTPIIDEIDDATMLVDVQHDFDLHAVDDDTDKWTIGDLISYVYDSREAAYEFDF